MVMGACPGQYGIYWYGKFVHQFASPDQMKLLMHSLINQAYLTWARFLCHLRYREGLDIVVCINSLTTVGYLLELFIRLWIPFLVHIFTSAWS